MANIRFDIAYYDTEEEELFATAGVKGQLDAVIAKGLRLEELELVSKGMFIEAKNALGWKSRADLAARAARRFATFEDYFDTSSGTLVARHPSGEMGPNTAWMGVGAGIAVMDEAFGLHDADWETIMVGQKKDLDFRAASTGAGLIVVEAKGAVVTDSAAKTGSVPTHKQRVKAKKDTQRTDGAPGVLIGTIAAIPEDANQTARVWLVDPPLRDPIADPARFKILARLRYYRALLSGIGRPLIAVALSNRLVALEQIDDYRQLDGLPLVDIPSGVPPSFITQRSRSVDNRLVVVPTSSRDSLIVAGLDVDVVPILIAQGHAAITDWSSRMAGHRTVEFDLLLKPTIAERFRQLVPFGTTLGRRAWYRGPVDTNVGRSGFVLGRVDP